MKKGKVGQLLATLDEREQTETFIRDVERTTKMAACRIRLEEDLVDGAKEPRCEGGKLDEVAESHNETFEQLTKRKDSLLRANKL